MWGLCIGNQTGNIGNIGNIGNKTNWLRWVLIQVDWLSYEKGKMSTQRQMHTSRTPSENEGRDWGDASTSQGLLASHYFFPQNKQLIKTIQTEKK